jgi:raffinose/stachyose/melibiose transport system substrate-binding protein
MKKILLIVLAFAICAIPAFASGAEETWDGGLIEVTIPYYKAGANVGAQFFLPQVARFNQKYEGRYKLNIEALVQDSYSRQMQLLAQQGRLPPLVDAGDTEWLNSIIIPGNMYVDLKPLYNSSADLKKFMDPVNVKYNTKGNKLFSVSSPVVRPIGMFYNSSMYKPSRSFAQMSWDQVSAELGDNKVAFMTSENAWTTMLTLSSLIAAERGGAAWLKSNGDAQRLDADNKKLIVTNFNTPIIIGAVTKLQQLLQKNASANTLGAAYADAANSFMSKRSAIIPNGSWMVDDFKPTGSRNWSSGFNGADVHGDVFPGNIVIGAPAVGYGWWIPNTATKQEQELAKAFIAFIMSPEELEAFMLVEGGTLPGHTPSQNFVSRQASGGLLAEYMGASKANTVMADDFGSLMPVSTKEVEFGKLLPLLINGTYTPTRFCQELTIKAREAMQE